MSKIPSKLQIIDKKEYEKYRFARR